MYKVNSIFRDKYNPQCYFQVGDIFESEDKNRIKDLVNRGLISKVKDDKKADNRNDSSNETNSPDVINPCNTNSSDDTTNEKKAED